MALIHAVASLTFKNGGRVEQQRRLFNKRIVASDKEPTAPMAAAEGHALSKMRDVLLPFSDHVHISGKWAGVA